MDNAVNRAYYAMFNVARAALLSAGMPESELPRTHNGVIAAFGQEAVKVRGLDPDLGRALGKTESLRLRAVYTGLQIDRATAEGAVARAEVFVRTVEREFGLEGVAKLADPSSSASHNVDEARQADLEADRAEKGPSGSQSFSIEETRRRAAQSWRRDYYDKPGLSNPVWGGGYGHGLTFRPARRRNERLRLGS